MSAIKIISTPSATDHRSQNRLSIYRSDNITATLHHNDLKHRASVYDLNSFGAQIRVDHELGSKLQKGDRLECHLHLPDQQELTYLATICWRREDVECVFFGLEFAEQLYPLPTLLPLHSADFGVTVPAFFSLVCFYYRPFLFYERGNAKIIGFSEKVWLIELQDSDALIYKSLELDFWLMGSDLGGQPVRIEIIDLRKGENGQMIVQALVKSVNSRTLTLIARHLMFLCDYSPVALRRVGLGTTNVSNGFRFRFSKTEAEYEEVLKLRYQAYLDAGKIDSRKTYRDMMAPLDPKSRILICYHGEKIVGSVAIAFPTSEEEVLDTEKVFPNGYPKPIPPKSTVVEIARLCTHSDYRRTDLLNRMFEYTYKIVLCGGRDHILTSTDSKLWPLYKKLGFKKTGMSYAHPYLNGREHHIILGRREQPDMAKNISPLAWNYLWRDMNLFMEDRGFVAKSPRQKIRLSFYIFIGKLLRIGRKRHY